MQRSVPPALRYLNLGRQPRCRTLVYSPDELNHLSKRGVVSPCRVLRGGTFATLLGEPQTWLAAWYPFACFSKLRVKRQQLGNSDSHFLSRAPIFPRAALRFRSCVNE